MTVDKRPRNVGPIRAAAFLYGDWGTSKAYVLGIGFALAGYSSFPLLVAMAMLTALVGLNYYWVCCMHPDGGGVYSSVRERSRLVATVGALLLIADYIVTASLSVLEGFNYLALLLQSHFHVALPHLHFWAIGLILAVGVINWWGPRHSGSLAVALALPASLAAISVALFSIPHLGQARFAPSGLGLDQRWMQFVGVILALSGVEAVSNMTGIMIPDRTSRPAGAVSVRRVSAKAIGIVAVEVVGLTILLAWAMHAVPNLTRDSSEAMLGRMADYFGRQTLGEVWGPRYAALVGIPLALLLFSAGNTALIDMISILYMMASDREMPGPFARLNRHGVPRIPLLVATALPCLVLLFVRKVEGLAGLYAIGVVGAIAINLAGCATSKSRLVGKAVRLVMGLTAVAMAAIWITIAVEKHEALVYAITILTLGLFARSFIQERRQVHAEEELRRMVASGAEIGEGEKQGPRLLVSLRGVTDTLRFAVEEARLRGARLGVLYVREVNVLIPVPADFDADPDAQGLFRAVRNVTGPLPADFLYRVSHSAPEAILEAARDYQADFLILGASAEGPIHKLLRGSVVNTIAQRLPKDTRLLIYSWRAKKGSTIPP